MRGLWGTLKICIQTILVVVGVGVCLGLIYFLTIFGGIALLGFAAYIVISEYKREAPTKGEE